MRLHRARGSSSVEHAIIVPVLLVVVFGGIQIALGYHADNVVQSAAASCAENARGFEATTADGQAAAEFLLSQSSGLSEIGVTAGIEGGEVRCTVTAKPQLLIAIGDRTISHTVVLPKEPGA